MLFLAASEKYDPISHVTDVYLIQTPGGTPILTMHMVTIIVVGVLFVLFMLRAAKAIDTGAEEEGNDRYVARSRFGQFVEAIIVYLRDEMLVPVLGEKAARAYLPFLMTLFFFVLFNNVFGLIPFVDILHLAGFHTTWLGGTATGNLAITAALAFVSFIMIQAHGVRELGIKGWLLHNFAGLVPGPIYLLPVALVVFVVELAGHLIKPAALAIRLFANMVAGHTLLAVLVSFGLTAAHGGSGFVGVGSVSVISIVASVLIMFLEVFVAFLQAFIFMFLTAVFMSLLSHHDDHEEHEHEEHGAQPAPA